MRENKYMKNIIIVAFLALVLGAGLGYYLGYDHGFEQAAEILPQLP